MSNPWIIDELDFYELEKHAQQMEFLLRYAILAPSGHNTQPWTFHIVENGVEVFADYSRRLPIADHHDRQLLLSIGAAIGNFRVAAAHFGFDTTVTYERRALETVPLATIRTCETCGPDPKLAALFPSIRQRHTNRAPYDGRQLDPSTLQAIFDLIDANPGTLRLILPRDTEHVAECLADADRTLMARPAYRAELADSGLFTGLVPWVIRHFDIGPLQARRDIELARSASMLLLVTADDDQASLLQAGEILERLLLTVTASGLQYSFLNAAVEETRERLRMLVDHARPPQLLVRIGSTASVAQPTPRRPVSRVIV